MTCAILTPSLGRPQRFRTVFDNIEEATPEPHLQLWCVGEPAYRKEIDGVDDDRVIMWLDDTDDPDKRYVTRMNKLAAAAAQVGADYVFFGQDDVRYHPGWLTSALEKMVPPIEVVLVNDLHNPYGTAALMSISYAMRAVFDQPGAVFHPGYKHNFADNEQHMTAFIRGVLERAEDAVVEHLNPIFGGSELDWDVTYKRSRSGWDHDQALFARRKALIEAALR